MILNLVTLSVALLLLTALLSILMLFIWRNNRTYPGFGFWAVANVVATCGFLAMTLRGTVSESVAEIIANTLTFGSFLLAFFGSRRFLDLSGGRAFSILLVLSNAAAYVYFTLIERQLVWRMILTSLFLAVISARHTILFSGAHRKNNNDSYKLVGALYGVFSFLMIVRAAFTFSFSDAEQIYPPEWIQALSLFTFMLFAVAWTFGSLVLNNERLQEELLTTKSEFERLATTDFLTGINNNRRFYEICEIEIRRAKRFRHPLSLIMFDLDYFKKINDTHGHEAGDKALLAIVEVCKFNMRELDSLGRLGGEEFAVLLTHTDLDVGEMVAERLRRAFEEAEIKLSPETTIRVTASFGVTELGASDTEIKALLNRADAALYEAKQSGRNQVTAFSTANQPIRRTFED